MINNIFNALKGNAEAAAQRVANARVHHLVGKLLDTSTPGKKLAEYEDDLVKAIERCNPALDPQEFATSTYFLIESAYLHIANLLIDKGARADLPVEKDKTALDALIEKAAISTGGDPANDHFVKTINKITQQWVDKDEPMPGVERYLNTLNGLRAPKSFSNIVHLAKKSPPESDAGLWETARTLIEDGCLPSQLRELLSIRPIDLQRRWADIDERGEMLLHIAVNFKNGLCDKNIKVAEILMAQGASPLDTDRNGKNCIEYLQDRARRYASNIVPGSTTSRDSYYDQRHLCAQMMEALKKGALMQVSTLRQDTAVSRPTLRKNAPEHS